MATLAKLNGRGTGDVFQVMIDDHATHMAVGKHIHQQIAMLLADVDETLAQTSRLMSPYEAHMAAFHFKLLRQELQKTEVDGRPSADILMMAGSWLLTRLPGLTPVLLRLLLASPTLAVIEQAGDAAVNWVEARAARYETEGVAIDLGQLRHVLATCFSLSELRTFCFDMGIEYEILYGDGRDDKAQELVAYCVRHGRVPELEARCRELSPYVLAGN